MPIGYEDVDEEAVEDFGPEEVVYNQGEIADHMYLVLEGEVECRVGGEPVLRVGAGEVLGETVLLEEQARTTSAVSVGDTRLLPLDRARFEARVAKDPGFGLSVLRTLARRLRQRNLASGGGPEPGRKPIADRTTRMLAIMREAREIPQGTTLFEHGDAGKTMFLVQMGTVELRVGGKPVATVEAGGFFGEMALLEEAPRSASAHAITDCILLAVDRAKFDYLVQRTPEFVVQMMREMAGRLSRMQRDGDPAP